MKVHLLLLVVISGLSALSFGQRTTKTMDGIEYEDRTDGEEMESFDVKFDSYKIPESQTYTSPEVEKKKAFKYYNNTYTYITIREKFTTTKDG